MDVKLGKYIKAEKGFGAGRTHEGEYKHSSFGRTYVTVSYGGGNSHSEPDFDIVIVDMEVSLFRISIRVVASDDAAFYDKVCAIAPLEDRHATNHTLTSTQLKRLVNAVVAVAKVQDIMKKHGLTKIKQDSVDNGKETKDSESEPTGTTKPAPKKDNYWGL